jgi:hypothetical protein
MAKSVHFGTALLHRLSNGHSPTLLTGVRPISEIPTPVVDGYGSDVAGGKGNFRIVPDLYNAALTCYDLIE